MCEAEGSRDPVGHVLQVARMRTFSLEKDPENSHSNRSSQSVLPHTADVWCFLVLDSDFAPSTLVVVFLEILGLTCFKDPESLVPE